MYSSSPSSATSEFDDILRHATSSRSPLAELVSDPILLRSITKSKRDKSHSKNHRRGDDKRRDHDSDSANHILSVVLAEEEREMQNLRSQLIVMAEQLKSSMRKAADAEQRAQIAQSRERETHARLLQVEHGKHQVDLENARQAEEMKRYRLQIDTLERQVGKMEFEMRTVEKERDSAEDRATDAKHDLRMYKQFIRDAQARDEGIEEGKRLGLKRGYSSGRLNGFYLGRQDGFDEGFVYGKQEGFVAGGNKPRRPERIRAQAWDTYEYVPPHKVVDEDGEADSLKRTQTWAESLSRQEIDDAVAVEPSSHQSSSEIGAEDSDGDLYVD